MDKKLVSSTLIKAVELLPELWKFGDSLHEAILSYRRALLHQWNLDAEITARIQKQFAIFLLYCGSEASPTNLFSQMDSEDPRCVPALLMESRICGGKPNIAEEGINFARRALVSLDDECIELEERRKLEVALYHAELLLKLEGASNIKGWWLLARILSAQKRFVDGETVLNVAFDQIGKLDQGELLRTKAKLQIAQGQFKSAIETYSQLLAVVQVQRSFVENFELEIWHDLAYLYISLSQYRDAEICLSKSKTINSYSAVRNHATDVSKLFSFHKTILFLYFPIFNRGLLKEALKAYKNALDMDPNHAPSLISAAVVMRQVGSQSSAVVKSLLINALRVDRMNPSAWYNLALLYNEYTPSSLYEATECFKAAGVLEDSAPVEPFR
ncbi:Detected protein of unknown function [Hibiscus syriacus]|uniref:Uncharacterized protein n=1 Tax=Hibiscus syriacus TaxID=106335 RepID=A0A6A2Y6W6_HIBSY|nr:Detected protein of unknown function [Hibiscus syriacus]